jgi:hypothetical protein
MKAPRPILAATVVALGLMQVLATPVTATAKATAANRACFHTSTINGWTAVGDRAVNVRVGVRDVWRLDLFAPCTDVDWNQTIALRQRGSSWICEGHGAIGVDVITHGPIGRTTCPVTAIRRLTPAEIAALPRKERP